MNELPNVLASGAFQVTAMTRPSSALKSWPRLMNQHPCPGRSLSQRLTGTGRNGAIGSVRFGRRECGGAGPTGQSRMAIGERFELFASKHSRCAMLARTFGGKGCPCHAGLSPPPSLASLLQLVAKRRTGRRHKSRASRSKPARQILLSPLAISLVSRSLD